MLGVGGNTVHRFAYDLISKLLSKELAKLYSWNGKHKKMFKSLHLTELISNKCQIWRRIIGIITFYF